MNINNMTRMDFESLPHRGLSDDVGEFDSMVILPAEISKFNILKYRLWKRLASIFSFIKEPEIYDIYGMHDSGYRCMDFIAIKDNVAFCRLSGCSDVIHLDGIGGYGKDWYKKYEKVPSRVPVHSWNIDCLPTSGLLRIWCRGKLEAGAALSSFDIFAVNTEITT